MASRSSSYAVGIDIGTTYTAAAVHTIGEQDGGAGTPGRWHMAELGTRATAIPSLVLLRDDGTMVVGEAADRRALLEPTRVAREFKRRLGDSVPLLLGGTPFSAEQLTARMLRAVLDQVTEVEGGPPARIALTHPANWGAFKLDVLRAAVQLAGEDPRRIIFLSEPEAAALAYAAHDRPPAGARVAVYDLGGGTFDVAILEDHAERYALVGAPGGVERLGGIDFDEALFRHVLSMVDGADALDDTDPLIMADLVALRLDCVAAKEALSEETDTAVAVRVGSIREEIRIVRAEFEALIRPTLEYTTEALARTLEESGLTPDDLFAVLLVGGSSRIPLVSQLVAGTLGRPVALDIHPKHAVALGASLVAAGTAPAQVASRDLPIVVNDRADDRSRPGPPGSDEAAGDGRRPPTDGSDPTMLRGATTTRADVGTPPPDAATLGEPRSTSDAAAAADAANAAAVTDVTDVMTGPERNTTTSAAIESAGSTGGSLTDAGSNPERTVPTGAETAAAEGAPGSTDHSSMVGRAPRPPRQGPTRTDSPQDAVREPVRSRSESNRGSCAESLTPPDDADQPDHADRERARSTVGHDQPLPPRRHLGAIVIGVFAGIVALAAVLLIDGRPDDPNGPSTSTSLAVNDDPTATAATGQTGAPDTTISRDAATAELQKYLNLVNAHYGELIEAGDFSETSIVECDRYLEEIGAAYGPLPGASPVIPPMLQPFLDAADQRYAVDMARYIDVDLRRARACSAGDQPTYEALRDEAAALRDALRQQR